MVCLAASGMAWGRMPLGENHPESGPSAVVVPNLPSESTITTRAVAAKTGRTMDIVDKAPVTFLAKTSVHTGVMADDDIIIGRSDTRAGHAADGNVIARGFAALERLITDGCVVVSGGVGMSASQPVAVLEPPVVLFMSAK